MSAISFDKIKELITSNGYGCVRAYNSSGHLLLMYDGTSSADLIAKLQEMTPIFSCYGVVSLKMGKKFNGSNGLKDGVSWNVLFSDPNAPPVHTGSHLVPQPVNPFSQMGEMFKAMQLMQGVMGSNNQGMSKEYIDLTLQLNNERHKRELEKATENNSFSQYAPLAPFILSAMGKTPTEIKEMMALSALGSTGTRIAGAPGTVTTETLEEIKKMSNEEKNAAITKAWDDLTAKLPAETMLMLLQTLNKKPELADKAIQLVQSGMI